MHQSHGRSAKHERSAIVKIWPLTLCDSPIRCEPSRAWLTLDLLHRQILVARRILCLVLSGRDRVSRLWETGSSFGCVRSFVVPSLLEILTSPFFASPFFASPPPGHGHHSREEFLPDSRTSAHGRAPVTNCGPRSISVLQGRALIATLSRLSRRRTRRLI